MLKVVSILVVLCGISAGYSIPSYNAYMYYQQPMGPQQTMYGFHYQNQQLRNQHRLAGMSAFAAGTALRGAQTAELPAQDETVESVAEAFPAEQFPVDDEPQYDGPAVYDQEFEEPIADEPIPAAAAPVAPAPAAVPEKKKKKVTVQLDSDEDEDDQVAVSSSSSSSAARGRPSGGAPSAYFPINFGSTKGGSIAVANSYSTGKDGSAVSNASAYGSPAANDQQRRAAAAAGQLRKRPAKQY